MSRYDAIRYVVFLKHTIDR